MKSDYKASQSKDFVLFYASLGWEVIPLHTISNGVCSCGEKACQTPGKHPRTKNGVKDATNDIAIIDSWWKKWPNANIGIATGKKSGLVVLDIDPHSGGDVSFDKLIDCNKLPDTIATKTGGGGKHFYFKHPGDKSIKNAVGLQGNVGIDIRADGGYVIAPPSLHNSGKRYEFEISMSPEKKELADLPPWLYRLLTIDNKLQTDLNPVVDTGFIPEGRRNDTLTRIAGSLRRYGLDQQSISSALLVVNKKCIPPLADAEVKRISKSIAKYPPAVEVEQFSHTDLGNSEIMAALYDQDLKYCANWKKWFVWNGKRWALDEKKIVYQKAKETIMHMYSMGKDIKDDKKRADFMNHASRSESAYKLKAMIELASSHVSIAISPNELDNNPWLLNTENGMIDLKTKELRNHDRRNLITKIIPVVFDEQAQCNRWLQFLDEVIGDKPTIDFVQLAIGWSLTGVQKDHKIFILYGTGANGKSTFLNTLLKLLGDYGVQTPTDTLLLKWGSGIPNDIARMKGARFVSAVEAQEGKRLNETLIKQLTGGDPITARFLHAEFFTFYPEFKLWLGTNHKPIIRETTHAIWRRICLIPFTEEISSEKQDKELLEKLESELPGILNWALEGCLKWQKYGLPDPLPEKIDNATTTYRTEMDILSNFLDECCELEPGAMTRSSYLHEAYSRWCDEMGEKALSQRWFSLRLEERGLKKNITRQGRFWLGIKLKRCDA